MTKNVKGDIDILSDMLQNRVYGKADKADDGRLIIKLQERKLDDTNVATIRNVPDDILVIRADDFPDLSKFFMSKRGVNRRADFIIISEMKKVILYIEHKSGSEERVKIEQQLKGAACVLAYCREAGKQFWNKSNFLKDYKHRYIGIARVSIGKQPTGIHSRTHDRPETYLSVPISDDDNDIEFNKLVGR